MQVANYFPPPFIADLPESSRTVIKITAWCLIGISILAFYLHGVFGRQLFGKKPSKSNDLPIASTLPKINIVIGKGGLYEHKKSSNLYTVTHTASIGVRNEGAAYLSNCKLHCEIMDSDINNSKRWLREDTFTLNIGEERYVSLASYNEPIPPQPKGGDTIQLHAPVGSGYGGFLPTLPIKGGALTITASCAESTSCEAICKLWVVNGKLNWEQA